MKNGAKYFALALGAFILGMSINNYAISNVPTKIAVVDVNKVVISSNQIKKIKKEREDKIKDLKAYIKTSSENIQKETDAKKKKDLHANFTKEVNTRKTAIQKEYAQKLSEVDKAIAGVIAEKAQAGNYEIVLNKGVVLYGGNDITAEITKSIK